MTPEQLDAAVEVTGLERLRWLTSEENPDARRRRAYREYAVRAAEGRPHFDETPRPSAAESIGLLKQAKACPNRSAPSCSCAFARCGLTGKDVSARHCIACIREGDTGAGRAVVEVPIPPPAPEGGARSPSPV